jgi:orotate phosphoribosyltransferase
VVVEDLISTGGSSLKAVEALKEAGFMVLGMVAIFTYGFKVAEENFSKANVKLFTLSNYDALIAEALKKGYVKEKELESLRKWRKDPAGWKG